jgi:ferredoxin-type protein NapH
MKGKRRWTRWRRAVQFVFALLFIAIPLLNSAGHHLAGGTLISFGIGEYQLLEPSAAASSVLAAQSLSFALLIGVLPLILLALFLGPVFCSWICPWGLISEGIDRAKQKLRRANWPDRSWSVSRRPRIAVFALLLGAGVLAGFPLAAFISGPRLITSLPIEMIFLRVVPTVTGTLLLALLLFEVLAPRRLWCRVVCPAGTAAALIRTPRTLGVRFDASSCLCPSSAPCHTLCSWGVDPRVKGTWDACTNCLRCVEICPSGSLAARLGMGRTQHGETARVAAQL